MYMYCDRSIRAILTDEKTHYKPPHDQFQESSCGNCRQNGSVYRPTQDSHDLLSKQSMPYEPRHEKTCLCGLRPGKTQTATETR